MGQHASSEPGEPPFERTQPARLRELLQQPGALRVDGPEQSSLLFQLGLELLGEGPVATGAPLTAEWTTWLDSFAVLDSNQLGNEHWCKLGLAWMRRAPDPEAAFGAYFTVQRITSRNLTVVDFEHLDACIELLPLASLQRFRARAAQAQCLIQLGEPRPALAALADMNRGIDPGNRAGKVFHAMLCSQAYLQLARPKQATLALQEYLPDSWDQAQPGDYYLVVQWTECLIGSERHAEAILLLDQILALGWPETSTSHLLYRRGVCRAEAAFAGDTDGTAAILDLEEALLGPLSSSSRRLALLALLELHALDRNFDGFQTLLPAAQDSVSQSANPLHRLRLERLRALLDLELKADHSRLRTHLDTMTPDCDELLKEFTSAPMDPHGVAAFYSGDRADVIITLIDLALAVDEGEAGVRRALEFVIDFQMAGELVRGTGYARPSVSELIASLAPQQGLLALVTGRRHSHLFAVSAEGALHESLPSSVSLRDLGKRWSSALASGLRQIDRLDADTPKIARERRAAQQLSTSLLPPRIAELVQGWQELLSVGVEEVIAGDIAWLPLGTEMYLGLLRDTWEWPSIPAGMKITQEARSSGTAEHGQARLILGGGALHSRAARSARPELLRLPLPDSLIDLAKSGSAFRTVELLEGETLTPEQVDRRFQTPSEIALFFLHSIEDDTKSPLSNRAFVLSDFGEPQRGLYYSFDVAQARSREVPMHAPRIAILAACRAGDGIGRRGAGIGTDMGSAFLLAGCQVTLSSSSNLLAGPAERMSAELLGGLVDGQSPAGALRNFRQRAVREMQHKAVFMFGRLKLVGAAGTPILKASQPPLPDPELRAAWIRYMLASLIAGAIVIAGLFVRRRHRTKPATIAKG